VLGEALGRDGRADEAFAAYERARTHAEAVGDRMILRDIVGQIARFLLDGPTPAPEAIERLEALRPSARNDTELDAGIRRCLAYALAMVGRFDEAREHIDVASAETTDQTSFSFSSHWMAAHAKELAGDIAGAERELIGPFRRMRDARGDKPESRAMRIAALLAHLYADQGRWDEAADYLIYGQEVDRLEPALGKIYTPLRLAARARLAAHRGDLPEGLELARTAVDVAAQGPYVYARACAWLALAEVQSANGQAGEAEASVLQAAHIWEAKGNIVGAARVCEAGLTPSDE
jgi:tetratricopeptide (TPR) repeat protein